MHKTWTMKDMRHTCTISVILTWITYHLSLIEFSSTFSGMLYNNWLQLLSHRPEMFKNYYRSLLNVTNKLKIIIIIQDHRDCVPSRWLDKEDKEQVISPVCHLHKQHWYKINKDLEIYW